MIPDSIGAVVAFLLLIAPGYVWDRQACRFTPEQRTTALREAAHIVFSSLIPSTLAGLALLPVWLLLPTTAVSPLLLLAVGLLTCAVACAIAFGWSCLYFWPERALVGQISRGSALFKALVGSPRRSDITQVVITAVMDDGTLWRGVHGAHDVDPEETPRMLFLTPPVLRRDPGRVKIVRLQGNEYVVLPLERVRSLQLTYLVDPKQPHPLLHPRLRILSARSFCGPCSPRRDAFADSRELHPNESPLHRLQLRSRIRGLLRRHRDPAPFLRRRRPRRTRMTGRTLRN